MSTELLILLIMLAVFFLCNFLVKMPVSLSMGLGAVAGAIAGLITGCQPDIFRHLFEGTFTYIDTILIIATAMIFMSAIQESGALDALNAAIVTHFYKAPAIMLILLMLIIMFPGMVTGSSTAAVMSAGALVAPTLLLIGIPKEKTGAIVALGGVLGMAAPPVNIPALLITGGVDMPYVGFEKPLFFILLICAVFSVLLLGLPHCKNINIEILKTKLDLETGKKYGFKLYIPIIVLAVLLIVVRILPLFGISFNLGMPLTFLISAVIALFTGKKMKPLQTAKESVRKTIPVLGKLIGVGMFIQVMTLTGARAWIVGSCLSLPTVLLFIAICVICPLFGAVSSYGSASVLGVPFLLALIDLLPNANQTIMAAALSVIVCMGDLMPPTALAGNFAAQIVGLKYSKVLKHCLIPFAVTILFAFAVLYFSGYLKFLQ